MKFKKIISSILLCTVLAGCSDSITSHEIPSEQSNCPISTLRTGTERQGIRTYGNGFECTETGTYFMCPINGISWLLYTDHSSDTIIKLCGRPDCNHTGKDCNAYFDGVIGICYYNGFLYTFDLISGDLIRMNLDGAERKIIYNVESFEKANGFDGSLKQRIYNGILFVTASTINENGETKGIDYYYKLDGSMKEPKIMDYGYFMKADGESFVGVVDYDAENNLYTYGIWDPEKETVAELFKCDDIRSYGYIGTKAEYYIENGIIIENSYTEGKKELIDTGLNGDYQLICFPDCIVMYEKYKAYEEKNLYFYDWDCNDLGSVKIDYEFNEAIAGFICGETSERIFLTDDVEYAPRYYINKSDFGTGNIEIHALNLPDFGEE